METNKIENQYWRILSVCPERGIITIINCKTGIVSWVTIPGQIIKVEA